MQEKMKIEIWSDVVCPYCYIGKRKIEAALEALDLKDSAEVEWKSYQLNPNMKYQPGRDSYDYLAMLKGQTREWAVKVHDHLTAAAHTLGLDYRFANAKMTNSFQAHQIIQLAKEHGKGDEMEERLFKAYFTEGELISDPSTLIRLATETGLDQEEVTIALETNRYAAKVMEDVEEARQLGISAVPFFVFERKYAVIGAQDVEVFKQTLQKTLQEKEK